MGINRFCKPVRKFMDTLSFFQLPDNVKARVYHVLFESQLPPEIVIGADAAPETSTASDMYTWFLRLPIADQGSQAEVRDFFLQRMASTLRFRFNKGSKSLADTDCCLPQELYQHISPFFHRTKRLVLSFASFDIFFFISWGGCLLPGSPKRMYKNLVRNTVGRKSNLQPVQWLVDTFPHLRRLEMQARVPRSLDTKLSTMRERVLYASALCEAIKWLTAAHPKLRDSEPYSNLGGAGEDITVWLGEDDDEL
jgi:hypothetical protein